jgi:NADPH-dependent curcumin reductase CurA
MSVDPYMRGRMIDRPSYVPPFPARVGRWKAAPSARSRPPEAEGFAPGDLVLSMLGWREAFTAPADQLTRLETFGLPGAGLSWARRACPGSPPGWG